MEKGGVNWSKMVKNFFTSAADGKGGRVTFYFYDVIFYWKQSFRGHCVPKLEFGNEGQRGAIGNEGHLVTRGKM